MVSDFLAEQRRLLPREAREEPERVRVLDGSMLVIRVRALVEREGVRGTDPRFLFVLRFVLLLGTEIERANLGRDAGDRFLVREELVAYLLARFSTRREPGSDHGLLSRFLDEWGHRWF